MILKVKIKRIKKLNYNEIENFVDQLNNLMKNYEKIKESLIQEEK